MLTRPDKMKLHTLIGNYPNAMAMKDGRVKSDLVEFDFPDFPVPNRGFKPMVREHKFDCGELAIVTFLQAREFGLPLTTLNAAGVQTLEPSLRPVFAHAVFWPKATSLSNPLAVTRAYARRYDALGGLTLTGDARTLHRSGSGWRVETNEGGVDAANVVVALGHRDGSVARVGHSVSPRSAAA